MLYDSTPRITVTHKPTGHTVTVRYGRGYEARSQTHALRIAKQLIAGHVATLAEPAPVVRSYHLDMPGGMQPFMRDGRTGETYRGTDVVLAVLDRGELDRVRK